MDEGRTDSRTRHNPNEFIRVAAIIFHILSLLINDQQNISSIRAHKNVTPGTRQSAMTENQVNVQLTLIKGTGLVAKDRNMFGKKTSSDPYVEVWAKHHQKPMRLGRTATKTKTLEPVYNQTFTIEFQQVTSTEHPVVVLKIFDEDLLSKPDLMGTVTVPILHQGADCTKWYEVDPNSAKNASGKLQIRLQTTVYQSRSLVRGNAFPLTGNQIYIGLAWDMVQGKNVDLDTSCVAISKSGDVLMSDTVYYANTCNRNESIVHSGDEQEGDEIGDDESITLQLNQIPANVLALYLVLTVATPGMQIPDITSTKVEVTDLSNKNLPICSFAPAMHALSRNSTAMFMVRIARSDGDWVLTPMEDTHPTARDFGSLIPFFKSYTRDLLPSLVVDPTERVAILRKGGTIRLADYCTSKKLPRNATFGLAWDVTDGVNIDLDASAICLDANLGFVDHVYFGQLNSRDGSIQHHGDEREGDEIGDDEKMDVYFDKVCKEVKYIGFVINSFTGQELDDVARASCHLFDPETGAEMASYAMTDAASLNGYTALVVACLYRSDSGGASSSSWNLCIISEPAQGRTVKDNIDELQNYLRRNPPKMLDVEEEEIDLSDTYMPQLVPFAEDEEIDLSAPVQTTR
jgi:tellurium resistance protein TerZ